ncbi:hypothetical protein DVH05_010397 [Phytophthora capsici]|nr:hypothetical protein DVH05_010397 [Phytophthora capsici]
MRGKCSFSDCDFTEADDVDATKCSSCSKMVHHICSNAVYEGELSVRVCSQTCCVALGLKKQPNALGASTRPPTGSSRHTDGAEVRDRAARKRSQAKNKLSNDNNKSKQVKADDNKKQGQRSGRGVKFSASTTAKKVNPGKRSSGGKPSSMTAHATSTTPVKHSTTDLEVISRRDELQKGTHDGGNYISPSDRVIGDTALVNEDDSAGEGYDDAKQEDKRASKRKKFHFTAEDDLALLREILNVQPFAAKHGSVTARYQDVTDNLNEHLEETLSLRTVKERFFLLVKEFKTTDSEYRKKSGVPSMNPQTPSIPVGSLDDIEEQYRSKLRTTRSSSK